jgi:ABC-type Fe3+/spermidine/putrescine transport system ATPase subunit
MQEEIRRIHRELGTTIVYVTHDQDEALALSDRIALMHEGRIVQIGTPAEIHDSPTSQFVANFVGESTQIPGIVTQITQGRCEVVAPGGQRLTGRAPGEVAVGDEVVLRVRPSKVRVATAVGDKTTSDEYPIHAVVEDYAFLGEYSQYSATTPDGSRVLFHVQRHQPGIEIGQEIGVGWAETDAVVVK